MKRFHFELVKSAVFGCYFLRLYVSGMCMIDKRYETKEKAYEKIGDLEREFEMDDYSFIETYQI